MSRRRNVRRNVHKSVGHLWSLWAVAYLSSSALSTPFRMTGCWLLPKVLILGPFHCPIQFSMTFLNVRLARTGTNGATPEYRSRLILDWHMTTEMHCRHLTLRCHDTAAGGGSWWLARPTVCRPQILHFLAWAWTALLVIMEIWTAQIPSNCRIWHMHYS